MANNMSHLRNGACDCNCCMWHNSPTIKIVLAVIFLALIVDLAAVAIWGTQGYLTAALAGFIGLILLIMLAGWLISIACSCRGRHWIHGADADPADIAKMRYAKGEITKKQYSEILKDLKG